jgi:plastocyanin
MSVRINVSRGAKAVALASVTVMLLAACSDDGPDAPRSEPVPQTEAPPLTESTEPADDGIDDGDDAEAVPPNGETVDVIALDNTFRPETIEVEAGTEVHWENRGRNDHNVLPAADDEDWGAPTEDFLPGDEYALVFGTPGTYAYYCTLHGTPEVGMIGEIVVLPAG